MAPNLKEDFLWSTSDEPHAGRRREMLAKDYAPKLRVLMTFDRRLCLWILSLVTVQISVSWVMRSADIFRIIIAAYCIGGTCNHSLALALHELSHNLAFGFRHTTANRWLAFFANFPLGFPAASSFKKYHIEHHKFQGNLLLDADLPTYVEARLFRSTPGKIIWMMLQPFFYGLRPMIAYPRAVTYNECVNFVVQMTFNVALAYFASWKSLFYMFAGTLFGFGIHPISGHFISEHYMFVKGVETYSYYGPLNWLTHNVGYHNEHHDFPNVPGRLLPAVTKTAPEFYNNLPCHRSWSKVLFDFATDPRVGIYSRVKRLPKNGAVSSSAMSSPRGKADGSHVDDDAAALNDSFVARHHREAD